MQSRIVNQTGSSPLTRGKQTHAVSTNRRMGLIPAHAGKTLWFAVDGMLIGAHPRSRGENFHVFDVVPATVGSSPLTRGKLAHGASRVFLERLIPAHAGKTETHLLSAIQARAHPRSRGENRAVHRIRA